MGEASSSAASSALKGSLAKSVAAFWASIARREMRAASWVGVLWLVDMPADRRAAGDGQADDPPASEPRNDGSSALPSLKASHNQGRVDQPQRGAEGRSRIMLWPVAGRWSTAISLKGSLRWSDRGLALLVLVVGCAIACGHAEARPAAGLCIITPCTPDVSSVTVAVHSSTSATFTGTINPHGEQVEYRFEYASDYPPDNGPDSYPPFQSLPASYVPETVSENVPLVPGARYYASLAVDSDDGTPVKFAAPLMPALPVHLQVSSRFVSMNAPFQITARAVGDGPYTSGGANLQFSPHPGAGFSTISFGNVSPTGQISFVTGVFPVRNGTYRVEAYPPIAPDSGVHAHRQPSFSKAIHVDMLPQMGLEVLPVNRQSRRLVASLYIDVHQVSHRSRGPDIYFYMQLGSGQRWRLVGRRPIVLLPGVGPSPVAGDSSATLPEPVPPGRIRAVFVCTRRPIMPDMGPHFRYTACGHRTLASSSPARLRRRHIPIALERVRLP
jgi:hypothetical protein